MPAPKGNKFAAGNKGGGDVSCFQPTYVQIGYAMALLGATDKDIAAALEVTEVTINNWKRKHEEFRLALLHGKMIADAKVARALYERACGYEHLDVDIRVVDKKIVKTAIIRRYPPDTQAARFWLMNRQPQLFRDRAVTEITGSDGGPIQTVSHHVTDYAVLRQRIKTKSLKK